MRFLSSSIAIALVAACGANPGTRPGDMTATEHRAEARRHDAWGYHWDSASAHLVEAQEHWDAATVLEKRYRAACGLVDPKLAPVDPFARFAKSIAVVDRGVVLRLGLEAGPPDKLLAEVQCHTAWLQLAPRVEAATDICAVKGIEYMLRAEPNAIAVTITSPDPGTVTELRRRAELLIAPRVRTTSNP